MSEKTVETKLTIQQMIRENGELIHADEELNQDGLPVYFKLKVAGDFYMVVDMEKKDEIAILTPDKIYKVVTQMVAELIFELAAEHLSLQADYDDLAEDMRVLKKPPVTIPTIFPEGQWPPVNPPYTLDWTEKPIPDGTITMEGKEK